MADELPEKEAHLFGVSGMTHSQSVKVRPQVVTAKCSEPQVESREAGMEEVV